MTALVEFGTRSYSPFYNDADEYTKFRKGWKSPYWSTYPQLWSRIAEGKKR